MFDGDDFGNFQYTKFDHGMAFPTNSDDSDDKSVFFLHIFPQITKELHGELADGAQRALEGHEGDDYIIVIS